MIPEQPPSDEALEWCARFIEGASLSDWCGVMAKRKRDREDAQLRKESRSEMRQEMAAHLRAMKSRSDLDVSSVLARLAALPVDGRHDLYLRDAWPLAWKGLLDITVTIKCNSNGIPPEARYTIKLTDEGRGLVGMESAS